MKVALVMGSDSDWPLLAAAEDTLNSFGIDAEVLVASAHRTPETVRKFAVEARERDIGVIIAAAGAAAHLPGAIAAYTDLPVIGVPVNATSLGGLDALLSMVQMPAGVPVACMAINGAKNAALFAVQILAVQDAKLTWQLTAQREIQRQEIADKAERLEKTRQSKSIG
jgi:5-(carboxyamino)imidazole ribonucleotide mutase